VPPNTIVPPVSKTAVPRQPTVQVQVQTTRSVPTVTSGGNDQPPSRVPQPQPTNRSPASPIGEMQATEAPQATAPENHNTRNGAGSTEPTEPPS